MKNYALMIWIRPTRIIWLPIINFIGFLILIVRADPNATSLKIDALSELGQLLLQGASIPQNKESIKGLGGKGLINDGIDDYLKCSAIAADDDGNVEAVESKYGSPLKCFYRRVRPQHINRLGLRRVLSISDSIPHKQYFIIILLVIICTKVVLNVMLLIFHHSL